MSCLFCSVQQETRVAFFNSIGGLLFQDHLPTPSRIVPASMLAPAAKQCCMKPIQVYNTERCTERCVKHCTGAFWCLVLDYDHFGYACKWSFGVWSWTTATSANSAKGVLVFGPGLRPLRLCLQRRFWYLVLNDRNFHDFLQRGCRPCGGHERGTSQARVFPEAFPRARTL